MPLIQCPDCRKDVSDSAPACIHCGRPAAPKKKTQPISKMPLPPRDIHVFESTGSVVSHPQYTQPAPAPGSNAGPAIASLFLPGLGQLVQGRGAAAGFFAIAAVAAWVLGFATGLWLVGGLVNIGAAVNAAMWDGRGE